VLPDLSSASHEACCDACSTVSASAAFSCALLSTQECIALHTEEQLLAVGTELRSIESAVGLATAVRASRLLDLRAALGTAATGVLGAEARLSAARSVQGALLGEMSWQGQLEGQWLLALQQSWQRSPLRTLLLRCQRACLQSWDACWGGQMGSFVLYHTGDMRSLEQEAPEVTASVALECCKAEAAQEGRGQRAVLPGGAAADCCHGGQPQGCDCCS
jgi:hypothetical protein